MRASSVGDKEDGRVKHGHEEEGELNRLAQLINSNINNGFRKAGFAIGEIEFPQAPEFFIKTKLGNFRPHRLEAFMP